MTLMTAAEPSGPIWKSLPPIASSAGRCSAHEVGIAAGKQGDLAARGEMHAAGHRQFERVDAVLAAMPARRNISSRPSVDISIQVEPAAMAGRNARSTRSDTAGEGRQVITASQAAASPSGEAAHAAPAARCGSAFFRSHIVYQEIEARPP